MSTRPSEKTSNLSATLRNVSWLAVERGCNPTRLSLYMFLLSPIGNARMSEQEKQTEPNHYVLDAERGKYEVTINLVTQVSTTANASFDKYVSFFTKRIGDKAEELGIPPPENGPISKSE
jgi:hypothetical protein